MMFLRVVLTRLVFCERALHSSRGPARPAGSGSVSPHVGSPDRRLRQSNDLKYARRWRSCEVIRLVPHNFARNFSDRGGCASSAKPIAAVKASRARSGHGEAGGMAASAEPPSLPSPKSRWNCTCYRVMDEPDTPGNALCTEVKTRFRLTLTLTLVSSDLKRTTCVRRQAKGAVRGDGEVTSPPSRRRWPRAQ